MKFGKEFRAQMVPEWQAAYMDYDYLKTQLKEIQRFHARDRQPARLVKRKSSLYRAFSGLIQRQKSQNQPTSLNSPDQESQVIVVNSDAQDGSQGYETGFLMTGEEGGEYELVFFRRLDDEFNKVNKFYKSKVEEVLKEADMLTKQMNALIAFRIKVENPNGWGNSSNEITRLSSDVAASSAALSASAPYGARAASRRVFKDFILDVELEPTSGRQPDVSSEGTDQTKEDNAVSQKIEEQKPNNFREIRPAPLQVLERLKINNTLETPRSTIKGFLNVPKKTQPNFNSESLKKVEERLKQALVVFYNKLRLLKSYG